MRTILAKAVCVIAGCILAASCGEVFADVILDIDSGVTFVQNSGLQAINVNVSSDAGDAVIGLIADFEMLSGDAFEAVPGGFGSGGQIGVGNLASASSFERDAIEPELAYLSLDFTTAQSLPANPSPLASITVNTDTLAPGLYNISIDFAEANGGGIDTIITPGSFTVTAVPEPKLIGMLGSAPVLIGCVMKRRRRGAKIGSSK